MKKQAAKQAKTGKQVKTVGKLPSVYNVTIKIMGKTYRADGDSLAEALTNLKPIGLVKGVGILSVSIGGRTKEKVLTPPATYRLFSPSPMMREIALKNTTLMFGL